MGDCHEVIGFNSWLGTGHSAILSRWVKQPFKRRLLSKTYGQIGISLVNFNRSAIIEAGFNYEQIGKPPGDRQSNPIQCFAVVMGIFFNWAAQALFSEVSGSGRVEECEGKRSLFEILSNENCSQVMLHGYIGQWLVQYVTANVSDLPTPCNQHWWSKPWSSTVRKLLTCGDRYIAKNATY
jgi:hypothetical protein